MRKRTSFFILFAALLSLVATPACYTLLKHPKVKRVVYEEVNDKRCNTCHYADDIWMFHHPPNHRIGYGESVWDDYYLIPWWYNDYWYYDSDSLATTPLRSRGLRPKGSRTRSTWGGAMRHPPATKRVSTPVATESDDTKKGQSNEKPSKNRTVRPKKGKEKPKEKRKE